MTSAGVVKGALLSQHFLAEVLASAFERRLGEASLARGDRATRRWWRQAQAVLGPSSGVRAIRDVGGALFGLLGYRMRAISVGEDEGAQVLVCEMEMTREGVAIDLVVAPWVFSLDRVWRTAVRAGVASKRRWVLAFNGHVLRIVDVDRPYARRYIEFDLEETFGHERWFPIFWGLARASAFAVKAHQEVSLFDEIVRASELHGAGVRLGLQSGVRVALTRLSLALGRAARRQEGIRVEGANDVVAQALTLIYRLLFLLFAEARGLVPMWHPTYRDGYSIAMLQRQIDVARGPGQVEGGLWDAMRAISRLAHAGCETDEFSMTAFNGRLFSPKVTPLGERARISSVVVADVLRALTRTTGKRNGKGKRKVCERITYRDLGVEELGAIYERVLDHFPEVEAVTSAVMVRAGPGRDRQAGSDERDRRGSVAGRIKRKESGTFYTPRSMADYLVRLTLGPLVEEATPEQVLGLRVLDPAMGSGAFLVCACRYLAWAYEKALDRAARPLPRSEAEHAEIKRWIARQCLFGVDVNPVAVQLARLSLWLTTLMADAPLTFLDHHLRVGDSLIGASFDDLLRRLPADASRATEGNARVRTSRAKRWQEQFPLFEEEDLAGSMRELVSVRARFMVADDSPAVVREKEQLLEGLARDSAIARWQRLADIWCGAWFWDSAGGAGPPARAWPVLCDYVRGGPAALPVAQMDAWVAQAERIARARRFFHWGLEFPEAFYDEGGELLGNGGFDAIVGNPPWNVLRADDGGPGRAPSVRHERRGNAASECGTDERPDHSSQAQIGRFVRESGIYEPLPDAHPNLYQLFVDRSLALLKRGGRLGLVTPWGLACDHGSARLRHRLLERCSMDTIISFDNSARLFPVHRGLRFMLFSCTKGLQTSHVRCRLGVRDARVLERMEDSGARDEAPTGSEGRTGVVLTMGLLRRVSGEGLAVPDVRERIEIPLLDRMYSTWPHLQSADGWGVTFGRELNATDDRPLMCDAGEADDQTRAAGMRVIEGKHLRPFRVDVARSQTFVLPRHRDAVRAKVPGVGRARLAYREVAFPGQQFSLVAAMLPAGVVSTHTVFCLKTLLPAIAQWCLCALLNSLVCNYLVKIKAGAHITAALLHRVPVPRPLTASHAFRELARLARRLAHGVRDHVEREERYARVQALAASVYGVGKDEFEYVVGTFGGIEIGVREKILERYRAIACQC